MLTQSATQLNITPGSQSLSGVLSTDIKYEEYRFSLTQRSSLTISLTGLDGNAECQIQSDSQSILADGGGRSNSGVLTTTLDSGNYSLLVARDDIIAKSWHHEELIQPVHYSLNIQANFNSVNNLIWRNPKTGEVVLWQMEGDRVAATLSTGVTLSNDDWQVVSTKDFDHDGSVDFLWRNMRTGENAFWKMDGTKIAQAVYLPSVSTEWQLKGVGTTWGAETRMFWRSTTTGDVGFSDIRGMESMNTSFALDPVTTVHDPSRFLRKYSARPGLDWQIEGIGDIQHNGLSDILWRNKNTGQTAAWLLGVFDTITPLYINNGVSEDWKIEGIGDFNGHGSSDIFWRNTQTGQTAFWKVDAKGLQDYNYSLTVTDQNWKVIGLSDVDGDGKVDILWRNDLSGETGVWQMNGTNFVEGHVFGKSADAGWKLVNPHAYATLPRAPRLAGSTLSTAFDMGHLLQDYAFSYSQFTDDPRASFGYADSIGGGNPDSYYRFTNVEVATYFGVGMTTKVPGIEFELLDAKGRRLQAATQLDSRLQIETLLDPSQTYVLHMHYSGANITTYEFSLNLRAVIQESRLINTIDLAGATPSTARELVGLNEGIAFFQTSPNIMSAGIVSGLVEGVVGGVDSDDVYRLTLQGGVSTQLRLSLLSSNLSAEGIKVDLLDSDGVLLQPFQYTHTLSQTDPYDYSIESLLDSANTYYIRVHTSSEQNTFYKFWLKKAVVNYANAK